MHVTEILRNSSTHTFANCRDQESKSSFFVYAEEWYIKGCKIDSLDSQKLIVIIFRIEKQS